MSSKNEALTPAVRHGGGAVIVAAFTGVGGEAGRGQGPSAAARDLLRIVRINEEIKRVVAVAFRINIMALNAIFLAKRAGNAALGFGVLSNELRVFSKDLHTGMMMLTRLVHASVAEVSVVLQESQQDRLFHLAAALVPDDARLAGVLERRDAREAARARSIAALRRGLRDAVEDAARLVELGGVLAKSAKIEAAYGAAFAASLGQVSGEFDGVIDEIRISLDKLRQSSFFGRNA